MIERIERTLNDERFRDVALLGLRGVLAAVFVFHGAQKLFGVFGGHGLEGTAGWPWRSASWLVWPRCP